MTKRPANIVSTFKPRQKERFEKLLGEDFNSFCKILDVLPVKSLRVNTLKISIEDLKERLEKKWKISQPYPDNKEIIIIESELQPGELGKAIEHLLGYYYIQEISSMMPIIALDPNKNDLLLDLCAAPGSKTTQAASMMENAGTIIANDANMGRVKILSTNVQRCGVTNTIITKNEGALLCSRLKKLGYKFDKILIDAPCSGEGTIRSSTQSISMFNEKQMVRLSNTQKSLIKNSIGLLKENGEMIYSTCTHAPEENEAVISYILENFDMEMQEIDLPLKTRNGIISWNNHKYHKDVIKSLRIYPQDNNTEGFFIAKLKKK